MHTPLLVGGLLIAALGSLSLSGFFLRAWLIRREDSEHLFFGIAIGALAALVGCQVVFFARGPNPAGVHWLFRAMVVLSAVSSAALLHFALRHAGEPRTRTVMRIAYPLYGLAAAAGLAGGVWREVPLRYQRVRAMGLEIYNGVPMLAPAGVGFYVLLAATHLAVVWLLWRRYRSAGRGALAAPVGAALFAVTVAHDAAIGAGALQSLPLMPVGVFVMAYGVSLTLVARERVLDTTLTERTAELAGRSAELRASYRQLRTAEKELVARERLAVVGELAAVVAHQVRNPLAIVSNAVASLRRQSTRGGQRALLRNIIVEEMDRLERLVDHLLDYARPVRLKQAPVALDKLLQRTLKLADDRPNVVRDVAVPASLPAVRADPELLRQAFENVVSNAVQAMKGNGRLVVRATTCTVNAAPGVAVSFCDTGEGMSEQTVAQALSPFYTTRPTGTGLGLPIVSRIVEAHGGRVAIDSQPGTGTTVRLELPLEPTAPPVQHMGAERISLLP